MWLQDLKQIALCWVIIFTLVAAVVGIAQAVFVLPDQATSPSSVFDTPMFWYVLTAVSATLAGVSFVLLRRGTLSLDEFVRMTKNLGFNVTESYRPEGLGRIYLGSHDGGLLGKSDAGVYIRGDFAETDWYYHRPWDHTHNGIKFFFSCRSPIRFHHYVGKFDGKVKIRAISLPAKEDRDARARLSEFVNTQCKDIPRFELNLVSNTPSVMQVGLAPGALVFGQHIRENFPAVVEVLRRFRRFLGCPDEQEESAKELSSSLI